MILDILNTPVEPIPVPLPEAVVSLFNEEDHSWVVGELGGVSFGDRRLDRRLLDTAAKLAERPTGALTTACGEWADAKRTYGLFDTGNVSAEKILAPHHERARERLSAHPRILCV